MTDREMIDEKIAADARDAAMDDWFVDERKAYGLNPETTTLEEIEELNALAKRDREIMSDYYRSVM